MELPNWGCGLSAVAVYTGTFTMLVIKLKSCARCAGFELDLRTEKSRSQNFFNNSYRPKVELNRDVGISLGRTWPLEIFAKPFYIGSY